MLFIKDIFSQINFMLINLSTLINEIETNLTFCSFNKLHSSIMNVQELKRIVSNID